MASTRSTSLAALAVAAVVGFGALTAAHVGTTSHAIGDGEGNWAPASTGEAAAEAGALA